MHLDPRRYAGLLAGTLPREEARALGEHLSTDCEACAAFLAEREAADALDGRGDAALAAALPPTSASGNDLAFARIQRRLRPVRPSRAVAFVAVAAALVAVGVVGLVARQLRAPAAAPAWDGAKGAGALAPAVRLRFARLVPGGEAAKGASGEVVDRSATLLFEVSSAREASVALVRLGPDAAVEPIWRQRIPSGRTVLGADGRTLAYPLAALEGRQRFALVASDGELEPGAVERVAGSLAARPRDPSTGAAGALSYDMVEVSVR